MAAVMTTPLIRLSLMIHLSEMLISGRDAIGLPNRRAMIAPGRSPGSFYADRCGSRPS